MGGSFLSDLTESKTGLLNDAAAENYRSDVAGAAVFATLELGGVMVLILGLLIGMFLKNRSLP